MRPLRHLDAYCEVWRTTARNYDGGRYYHFLMANQPDWSLHAATDDRGFINMLRRHLHGQLARIKPFDPPNDWVGWTGAP